MKVVVVLSHLLIGRNAICWFLLPSIMHTFLWFCMFYLFMGLHMHVVPTYVSVCFCEDPTYTMLVRGSLELVDLFSIASILFLMY